MENRHIIGIGEALWDMLPAGRQIGGAPANFAYHMSQFGYDATAVAGTVVALKMPLTPGLR